MNNSHAENNKRIAKNTGALYIRMLFTMGVGLYTSRVILNVLGIEDYGIYNVVGGIISMFGFITYAMSTATSRYLTFDIGTGDFERLKKVFNLSISVHGIIALLIFVLGETLGLWFLNHRMQIPEARMDAAVWTLHFTIIAAISSIIVVPFNAAIISHEKMTAYAYISILEAVLKLLIVYLLLIIPFDKLKTYAFLFVISQLLIQAIYMIYSRLNFEEVRFRIIWDKVLFKEMLSFSSWNLIGNLASVTYTEGLNILINIFFGPAINAARGVAVQVQGMVYRFSSNFQAAINPQITKTYARKDFDNMHNLIFASSKYSFLLLFFLSLPILIETKTVLILWLKIVPDHTVNFIRLVLSISIIDSLANPLMISAQATGKIKIYQTIIGGILLFILPLAYISLKLGARAESVFVIQLSVTLIAQVFRFIIVSKMIKIRTRQYISKVILKIIPVTIFAPILPIITQKHIDNDMMGLIVTCILSALSVVIFTYLLGLSDQERILVRKKISEIKNDTTTLINKKYRQIKNHR